MAGKSHSGRERVCESASHVRAATRCINRFARVCVCEREREREEKQIEREREKECVVRE